MERKRRNLHLMNIYWRSVYARHCLRLGQWTWRRELLPLGDYILVSISNKMQCPISKSLPINTTMVFLNGLFLIFLIKIYFYNAVLVSAIQQCKSAIITHTSLPSLASLPSPILSLQVIIEHQTGLPVLHRNFSPAIHLTGDRVCMLMLLSPFISQSDQLING